MTKNYSRSYSSFTSTDLDRPGGEKDIAPRRGVSVSERPREIGEHYNRPPSRRLRSLSLLSSRLLSRQPAVMEEEPTVQFSEPQTDAPERPTRKRLVEKNGKVNVRSRSVPHRRYFRDAFTTMVDARWKWVIFMFLFLYMSSWTVFGTIWWLIVEMRSYSRDKCLDNVSTWPDAFLFSVETQQTIGYGVRVITNQCPEAVILLLLQSVIGCILDAVLLGLIFAKIARPAKRAGTIFFSDKAVVCTRNGKMFLVFQVGDLRKRQLLEAHIRLHLFRSVTTTEGRTITFNQENLRVAFDFLNPYYPDYDTDRLLLLHPIMMYHPIEERSPFYDMTPEELAISDWEIVAVVEGIVEATGCTVQARTSYLGDEVLWSHDFECSATPSDWCDEIGLRYPLSRINNIFPVDLPKCSPKEYFTSWQLKNMQTPTNSTRSEGL